MRGTVMKWRTRTLLTNSPAVVLAREGWVLPDARGLLSDSSLHFSIDLTRLWRTTKHENERAFNSFRCVLSMLAIFDIQLSGAQRSLRRA